MLNKKRVLLLSFLALSFLHTESYAKVEGFNIDGLLGVDLISGGSNASTSNLGYGGRIGYHLNPTWEMGAGFTTATNSTTSGTYSTSSTTGLLMGDLNFHFANEWNPFYLGIRLGMGISSGSTTVPGASTVNTRADLAYGFVGGYDFKVAESFTIGPKISYTMVSQPLTNLADFQAHAAFKYFF